ncbi:MAG TPA: hypothetical protein VHL09_14335, partial [Dehalococcoidia bacterium]|nr:hypothetical protein [Dehalococcoidia bacterium]
MAEQENSTNTRRRPSLTLVAVITGLLVAFGCIVAAGVIFGAIVLVSSAGPSETITRYYDAVRAGDYATAHAQLSVPFGTDLTQDDLRNLFTAAEAQDGRITNVSVGTFDIEGDTARVTVT